MLLFFLFDVVLKLLVKAIQRLCFDLQLPYYLGGGHPKPESGTAWLSDAQAVGVSGLLCYLRQMFRTCSYGRRVWLQRAGWMWAP
jgi:hypothetical protein